LCGVAEIKAQGSFPAPGLGSEGRRTLLLDPNRSKKTLLTDFPLPDGLASREQLLIFSVTLYFIRP